jgi:hypothetical protein
VKLIRYESSSTAVFVDKDVSDGLLENDESKHKLSASREPLTMTDVPGVGDTCVHCDIVAVYEQLNAALVPYAASGASASIGATVVECACAQLKSIDIEPRSGAGPTDRSGRVPYRTASPDSHRGPC